MKITREWAMPSKHTFTIKPIKRLIQKYVGNGDGWIDPFAGENSPAEITNDLNPNKPTKFHLTAIDFVNTILGRFKGVALDPPYSIRQMKEVYDSVGIQFTKEDSQEVPYFNDVKDALMDRVELAICCGWNSSGFGKSRGFELIEVLLVCHGGNGHNDTIVTVERKIK